MTSAILRLHHDCAALGTRLFTLSVIDRAAALTLRAYTSDPVAYPAHGTKPMPDDAWFAHCVRAGQPFVANSPAAFKALFPDHAQITAMGLGAALNVPLRRDGLVVATVNLLAETGHFTPERLEAYLALCHGAEAALLSDPALA